MNFRHFSFSIIFLLIQLTFSRNYSASAAIDVETLITFSVEKYNGLSSTIPGSGQYISTGDPTSPTWRTTGIGAWTCGFYAGSLWMLYKLTGDSKWRDLAEANQVGLREAQFDRGTHDVGFIIMSSYGHGLELTGNQAYEPAIIQAATTLCGRYFHLGGVIRSWNNGAAGEGEVKVIVDNMMNLNLLFKASQLTNDPYFANIAISHAEKTIEEHIRPDGGTFHVVGFNETTGGVRRKYTAQGYADWSTWARGQAWGIFGFMETYKNTNDTKFLNVAEELALYFINRLPEDYVPYWDFDAPHELGYEPRDTSAASIAATAFLELYAITNRIIYVNTAELILESLTSPNYRSDGNPNYLIPSILVNGTVHKTQNDFNTAIVYGDYYFLRAIDLYRQLIK